MKKSCKWTLAQKKRDAIRKRKEKLMLKLLRAFEVAHTDWVEIGMHRPEDWAEIEKNYLDFRKLVIAALR